MTKIIDENQPKTLKISVPPEIKHYGTWNYDIAKETVCKALVKSNKENIIDEIINQNKHISEYAKRIEEALFDIAKNTEYKYAYLHQTAQNFEPSEKSENVSFTVKFNIIPSDIEHINENIKIWYYLVPIREFIKNANIGSLEQLRNNASELARYYSEYYSNLFTNEQNKGESKHEE